MASAYNIIITQQKTEGIKKIIIFPKIDIVFDTAFDQRRPQNKKKLEKRPQIFKNTATFKIELFINFIKH